MKLVRTQCADDLQAELKNRFASFNRSSSAAKGRHYPIKFPSVVAIELSSVAALGRELLASLAAVEICHAASR